MLATWVNGEPRNSIDILDRGLAYGDGVFETIRIGTQGPTLYHYHMKRLFDGASMLGIKIETNLLKQDVDKFLDSHPISSGVLKIVITRGQGGRGYNPQGCDQSTTILSLFALPDYSVDNSARGIKLFKCKTRLGLSTALSGMKHLNRLEQVVARAEWQDTLFPEGLMLNINDQVIEGTMSNLFLVKNNALITPDLSLSGVAGVCREFILDNSKKHGIECQIKSISPQELHSADEVFVCNSVFGIWPVIAFTDQRWSVGKLTQKIQSWLEKELAP